MSIGGDIRLLGVSPIGYTIADRSERGKTQVQIGKDLRITRQAVIYYLSLAGVPGASTVAESAPVADRLRLRALSQLSGTAFAACAARPNAMQEIQLTAFDVNQLHERLQKMTDDELREFGKTAAYMVSPKANMGQPPREAFVVQLAEARAEWARRHPKKPTTT